MAPSNVLPIHGNEKTMNLNTLVLTNIQSSPYFKVHLYELKTYHQVIDEIYYKVNHLEPWEKGSRKTAGQTGMCGGVRGVGAGGIVSSAYCLLYKLYTLKLTRKQLIGLCTHSDSPYIRALGLMYIRYTQPPGDLWEWYEPYLDDEEQVDVKAGGGNMMTIGEIAQQYLTKLEWYSTLFPRIPVPIQKQIEAHLSARRAKNWNKMPPQHVDVEPVQLESRNEGDSLFGEAERVSRRETSRDRRLVAAPRRPEMPDRDRSERERSRARDERHSHSDVKREPYRRSRSRGRRSNSRDRLHSRPDDRDRHHSRPDDHHPSRSHDHHHSRSDDRHHSRSDDRHHHQRSCHRSQDRSPGRSHHQRSKDRKRSSSRGRKRSRSHEDRSAKRLEDGGHHSARTVDGPKRHHSSQQRSASPYRHANSGDAFDRDLQKELERVKAAKDTENGQKSTKTV